MPFCTACGKQNPDDARFCAQCGTKLLAGEDTGSSPVESTATITFGVPDQRESSDRQLSPDVEVAVAHRCTADDHVEVIGSPAGLAGVFEPGVLGGTPWQATRVCRAVPATVTVRNGVRSATGAACAS